MLPGILNFEMSLNDAGQQGLGSAEQLSGADLKSDFALELLKASSNPQTPALSDGAISAPLSDTRFAASCTMGLSLLNDINFEAPNSPTTFIDSIDPDRAQTTAELQISADSQQNLNPFIPNYTASETITLTHPNHVWSEKSHDRAPHSFAFTTQYTITVENTLSNLKSDVFDATAASIQYAETKTAAANLPIDIGVSKHTPVENHDAAISVQAPYSNAPTNISLAPVNSSVSSPSGFVVERTTSSDNTQHAHSQTPTENINNLAEVLNQGTPLTQPKISPPPTKSETQEVDQFTSNQPLSDNFQEESINLLTDATPQALPEIADANVESDAPQSFDSALNAPVFIGANAHSNSQVVNVTGTDPESKTTVNPLFTSESAAPVSIAPTIQKNSEGSPANEEFAPTDSTAHEGSTKASVDFETVLRKESQSSFFNNAPSETSVRSFLPPVVNGIQTTRYDTIQNLTEQENSVHEQVLFQVRANKKDNNIKFKLFPEDLGSIEITFTRDTEGRTTHVAITSEKYATYDLLNRISAQIHSAVEDTASSNSFSLSFGMHEHKQQQQKPEHSFESYFTNSEDSTNKELHFAAGMMAMPSTWSGGSLNLVV